MCVDGQLGAQQYNIIIHPLLCEQVLLAMEVLWPMVLCGIVVTLRASFSVTNVPDGEEGSYQKRERERERERELCDV